MTSKSKPRTCKNADNNGNYKLTHIISSDIIDTGDELNLELYITGYGHIESAKLVYFLPNLSIEKDKSYLTVGMKLNNKGAIAFGAQKTQLGDSNGLGTILLKGLQREGWEESTLFFDIRPGDSTVSTETNQESAPIVFNIKTSAKTKPGNHSATFALSYFNGNEWKCHNMTITFKVRSFFEKHAKILTIFGGAAAISTIYRNLHETGDITLIMDTLMHAIKILVP